MNRQLKLIFVVVLNFEHTGFSLKRTQSGIINYKFFIHGSVHRDSVLIRSNKIQQYGGIYLLQIYSTYFGRPSRPSSGVQKTVTAASGTGHIR